MVTKLFAFLLTTLLSVVLIVSLLFHRLQPSTANTKATGKETTRARSPMKAEALPLANMGVWYMAGSSNLVVTGKITQVPQVSHVPESSTNPTQYTFYEFAVEECFLDQCMFNRKKYYQPVLRIRMQGGNLPWSIAGHGRVAEGQGYEVEGTPKLQVGERYLIFLKAMDGTSLKPRATPRPTGDFLGDKGEVGEWDDFFPSYAAGSIYLLKDGKCLTPPGAMAIPYRIGPQLANLTEQQAVTLVSELCRDRMKYKETESNGTPQGVPDNDPRRKLDTKWTTLNYDPMLNRKVRRLDH